MTQSKPPPCSDDFSLQEHLDGLLLSRKAKKMTKLLNMWTSHTHTLLLTIKKGWWGKRAGYSKGKQSNKKCFQLTFHTHRQNYKQYSAYLCVHCAQVIQFLCTFSHSFKFFGHYFVCASTALSTNSPQEHTLSLRCTMFKTNTKSRKRDTEVCNLDSEIENGRRSDFPSTLSHVTAFRGRVYLTFPCWYLSTETIQRTLPSQMFMNKK